MPSVGKPIPHDSAVGHVTGTALFLDDVPQRVDELVVGIVGSPIACGRIEELQVHAALSLPGVELCLTAADLPAAKMFGPLFRDEPILAVDELLYVGQPVVAIAADCRATLEQAIRLVQFRLTPAEPILSIEHAIERGRFLGPSRRIARGDVGSAMAEAPHRLNGVFHNLGQDHFYLESQAALAYPGEDGQVHVHSSTQNPTEIQHVVAEALGLGMHHVVCVCKRMGGGFGGKETQAAIPAILAAMVAQKTGRAARIVYSKDEDMRSTGKRHAYRVEWEVGFDNAGQILAYKAKFHSDGGAAADLSTSVMERTMLHAENAYFIPNIELYGQVCFTNYPPNTAFRGFGAPQGIAAMENVVQEIAAYLRSPLREANGRTSAGQSLVGGSNDIQRRNLYGIAERNVTPYGQQFERNRLPDILARVEQCSDFTRRIAEIEERNRLDRLWLRGLAITPVKFGISFTTKFLNQANALVNVYSDGAVQVSTGGTEMGQGLNVKIRQLVADEFGLSIERVAVMATSTEKNINTSPTAASAGTDLNGAAAVNACRLIRERLANFAARQFADSSEGLTESAHHVRFIDGHVVDARRPSRAIAFSQLCGLARRERIDLGARGFYATPGVDYNRETGRGNPFFYFTQGAAAAEVCIDRFTGELTVPRVNLTIDVGNSINPGVDMGQVVGGFIQGMGWATGECLVYDDRGQLLTHSPTTYKIPAITDVPTEFYCEFLPSNDKLETVASSKAVGEPPLMLAIAVWSAVKHALGCVSAAAARELRLPATGEEILRVLTIADNDAKTVSADVQLNRTAVEQRPCSPNDGRRDETQRAVPGFQG